MYHAALAGVVVDNTVIFIFDDFARSICRRCDNGFAFATADDFNTAMVNCDRPLLSVFVEYTMLECYNLVGKDP